VHCIYDSCVTATLTHDRGCSGGHTFDRVDEKAEIRERRSRLGLNLKPRTIKNDLLEYSKSNPLWNA
jgi:hypothetical protein